MSAISTTATPSSTQTRRHLLSVHDLSSAQIREILETAAEMHTVQLREVN